MIGVFDSGIGGLTVVKALRKRFPKAHVLYVGDVARMPYGNKSQATITEYSRQITRYLISRGAKLVVIACNTASAMAADALREEFSVPILDVVTPAVRGAVKAASHTTGAKGKIAILGTRGTIAHGIYQRSLRSALPQAEVRAASCPMFVPIVEEGFAGTPEGVAVIRKTLRPLAGKRIDTVILGCTHYPMLRKEIGRIFPGARLIDSSAVADDVAALADLDPRILGGKGPKLEVEVTDRTEHFERFAKRIVGKGVRLNKLDLETLLK